MFGFIKNFFTGKNAFIEANLNHIVGQWSSTAYRKSYTASQFLNLCGSTYNSNPDFQEAVNKILIAMSKCPICLKDEKDVVQKEIPKEIKDFIKKPSVSGDTWKMFLRKCMIQFYVSGEIIPFKHMDTKQVSLIWSNELNKIIPVDGRVHAYQVSKGFFTRLKFTDTGLDKHTYENEVKGNTIFNQVAMFYAPNPILDFRGLSPIVSMLDDVQILIRGRQWNRNILENEGRPSGVFFFPPTTQQAKSGTYFVGAKKLEEDIKQTYAGPKNTGKALILKGGMQFKEISYKMKDCDFINGLKFSRETIANRLGIPLQLFGDKETSTYKNYAEAKTALYFDTVIPFYNEFLEFIYRNIICHFYPQYIDKYQLCVDLHKAETEQSSEQHIEKLKALDTINYMTTNEKREKAGLIPYKTNETTDNADKILVSKGLTLLQDIDADLELDDPTDPDDPNSPKNPTGDDKDPDDKDPGEGDDSDDD